jgi:L-fuculose-phosphate aldolase
MPTTSLDIEQITVRIRQAVFDCLACLPAASQPLGALELFHSAQATLLKQEIVRNGRKLWDRQYVDGNGGNISARLSEDYVLCTPTLLSKADLTVDDIVLVDRSNNLVCGNRPQTSEIRLHLEIYKNVPEAMAVIHCHPPYATAYAVAGVVPPGNLVPEQEVFVGPVALTPYETPGTQAFAETIVPVVRQHNTILLANHGIVCWADTVTHAEWYVEVVDTYCKTVMIAAQLNYPLPEIPPDKVLDLLAIKQKLGLPDERLPLASTPALKVQQQAPDSLLISSQEMERLVSSILSQITAVLDGPG